MILWNVTRVISSTEPEVFILQKILILGLTAIRTFRSQKQTNFVAFVCKRTYRQSDRRLLAKLVPTLAERGCRMVSATDPHVR
jgi:hypothetical protein